ncbi:MAG: hypothetical protein M0R74_02530 [Dehalococcoidia bacterium]|nr:hypothetical protein [Dehalococcoidia bacterium]
MRRGATIPPAATEPVWQASGQVNATAIVGLLRNEGVAATLKRVGDTQGGYGKSFYTATIYVPPTQSREARRILREHGETQYIVDMGAFRGIGNRFSAAKLALWGGVGAGAFVALLLLTGQL